MAWLGPLLKLLGGLLGLFREQQVRSEAKGHQAATDAAKSSARTVDEITTANAAGDAVERELRADPERVFKPDRHQRD